MIGPVWRSGEPAQAFLDPSQARRLAEAIAGLPHPEGEGGERLPKEYDAGFERMRREVIHLVEAAGLVVDLDEEE